MQAETLQIISVREQPAYLAEAIAFFQTRWHSVLPILYEDCITHSINARQSLPQWYLLQKEGQTIGGAGLITNDFISRGDLYPWLAAVYIDEAHRGHAYATLLMEQAKIDTKKSGFDFLYLSTEHIGYYEKYGFRYIGDGYHPWGGSSRIYEIKLGE